MQKNNCMCCVRVVQLAWRAALWCWLACGWMPAFHRFIIIIHDCWLIGGGACFNRAAPTRRPSPCPCSSFLLPLFRVRQRRQRCKHALSNVQIPRNNLLLPFPVGCDRLEPLWAHAALLTRRRHSLGQLGLAQLHLPKGNSRCSEFTLDQSLRAQMLALVSRMRADPHLEHVNNQQERTAAALSERMLQHLCNGSK